MSIETALIVVMAAIVGGLAGWFARTHAEKSQRRALGAHESEVAQATARARDRAREERAAAEERSARMRERYDQSQRRVVDLEQRLEQQADELRAARAELAAVVPAHGPAVVDLPEEWLHPAADGQDADDLTQIRGLGEVLSERLRGLGISRYRQLARITPDNVTWIAARLNIAPGRILKEHWALQARQLLAREHAHPVSLEASRESQARRAS
jgi:predicted flap endonuclease-1-like 5' DNA nuclease